MTSAAVDNNASCNQPRYHHYSHQPPQWAILDGYSPHQLGPPSWTPADSSSTSSTHHAPPPARIHYYDMHGAEYHPPTSLQYSNSHQHQHHPVASTSQLTQGNNNNNPYDPHAGGEYFHDLNEQNQNHHMPYSSVSDVNLNILMVNGEEVFKCPFCDKEYGGKHGRSIWRRHLSNKHEIPLNVQPRRTRWDNDANRPKDEAERHKRTLESKRRWAAKNRAEKRAKRKSARGGSGTPAGGEDGAGEDDREGDESWFLGSNGVGGAGASGSGGSGWYDAEGDEELNNEYMQHAYENGYVLPPQKVQAQRLQQQQQQEGMGERLVLGTQPVGAQQQQQHNPNFIPYERVPLYRTVSAPGVNAQPQPFPHHPSQNHHQYQLPQQQQQQQPQLLLHPQIGPHGMVMHPRMPGTQLPRLQQNGLGHGQGDATSLSPGPQTFLMVPPPGQPSLSSSAATFSISAPSVPSPIPGQDPLHLAPPGQLQGPAAHQIQRSHSVPLFPQAHPHQAQTQPQHHQIAVAFPPSYGQPLSPAPDAQSYLGEPSRSPGQMQAGSRVLPEVSDAGAPHQAPQASFLYYEDEAAALPSAPHYSTAASASAPPSAPSPAILANHDSHPTLVEVNTSATHVALADPEQSTEKPAQPPIASSTNTRQGSIAPATKLKHTTKPQAHRGGGLKKSHSNAEAALQLLALKTSSSSPPPSPVKRVENDDDDEPEERLFGGLVGDTSFADSGYGGNGTFLGKRADVGREVEEEDEDQSDDGQQNAAGAEPDDGECSVPRKRSRLAAVPSATATGRRKTATGLGSPVRHFSLSPASSPRMLPPSKMQAFTLAATPSKLSRRPAGGRGYCSDEENRSLPYRHLQQQQQHQHGRERISLESSPSGLEGPPSTGRRLLESSPSAPHRQATIFNAPGEVGSTKRQRTRTRTSPRTRSRTESANAGSHPSSGGATLSSSYLATPHQTGSYPRHANRGGIPSSLLKDKDGDRATRRMGGRGGSIFSIDTFSRPSASLLSSPGNILLSSPEHAAVSRSLGLVPEASGSHFASAFDLQFLDSYEGGVGEYAQGVFGNPTLQQSLYQT